MDNERIIQFETKLAFQEAAIETLQDVTIQQHKAIEGLEKQIAQLKKRLDEALDSGLDIGPANEKPPHY